MVKSLHEWLFSSNTTWPIIKKMFIRCFLAPKCRKEVGGTNKKRISPYQGVVHFDFHLIIHWDAHP